MGEVHQARDTKLDRDVALKVLPAPTLATRRAGHYRYEVEKESGLLGPPRIVRQDTPKEVSPSV